jgi:hypothetical protein
MDWRDLVIDGYKRIFELLEPALKGLSKSQLNTQPKPDANSLGWTVWHLARGQDAQIADLIKTDQLWIKDAWYKKFNRPADPRDTGFGNTTEQVSAFKSPSAKILLEYCRAVTTATTNYLKTIDANELNRILDESYDPKPTVGVRIVSVLADSLNHAGEASYIRGLVTGTGWLGY